MLCVGTSIGVFIAGRLLQGLSAAVVWVVGLALLVDTVGQQEVGQMMGYVSLSMSLGILAGPLLGGVVYEGGGYYAVFAMAFGLIGLDIILRLVLVEKKIAIKWSDPQDVDGHDLATQSPETAGESKTSRALGTHTTTPPQSGHTRRSQFSRIIHNLPPVLTLLKSRRLLAAL